MSEWPDLDAYKAWARIPAGDTTDDARIQPALDAATAAVLARCRGLADPVTGEPVADCPAEVVEAVLLWTNRLVARADSPTGIVGIAETGSAIVPARDVDIARLLAPYRTVVAG